jgi:hypothetical protein
VASPAVSSLFSFLRPFLTSSTTHHLLRPSFSSESNLTASLTIDFCFIGQDYENAHIAIAKAVETPSVRPPPAFNPAPVYGAPSPYQQPNQPPVYQAPPTATPRPAFGAPPNQAMYQPAATQPGYGHPAGQTPAYPAPSPGEIMFLV